MSNPRQTYLGDGLYVHMDGDMVILSTPRDNGTHWVALEPMVLHLFQAWLHDQAAKEAG